MDNFKTLNVGQLGRIARRPMTASEATAAFLYAAFEAGVNVGSIEMPSERSVFSDSEPPA
jgi:hypothetical protein